MFILGEMDGWQKANIIIPTVVGIIAVIIAWKSGLYKSGHKAGADFRKRLENRKQKGNQEEDKPSES